MMNKRTFKKLLIECVMSCGRAVKKELESVESHYQNRSIYEYLESLNSLTKKNGFDDSDFFYLLKALHLIIDKLAHTTKDIRDYRSAPADECFHQLFFPLLKSDLVSPLYKELIYKKVYLGEFMRKGRGVLIDCNLKEIDYSAVFESFLLNEVLQIFKNKPTSNHLFVRFFKNRSDLRYDIFTSRSDIDFLFLCKIVKKAYKKGYAIKFLDFFGMFSGQDKCLFELTSALKNRILAEEQRYYCRILDQEEVVSLIEKLKFLKKIAEKHKAAALIAVKHFEPDDVGSIIKHASKLAGDIKLETFLSSIIENYEGEFKSFSEFLANGCCPGGWHAIGYNVNDELLIEDDYYQIPSKDGHVHVFKKTKS